MAEDKSKLGPVQVWALAVGGMVGGGIYTVLGVIVAISAQWTWLSFLITGIIALTSAYSYVFLSNKFKEKYPNAKLKSEAEKYIDSLSYKIAIDSNTEEAFNEP